MPKFEIPFEYAVAGTKSIDAPSLSEAIRQVNELPISSLEGEYVGASFRVAKDTLQDLNPKVLKEELTEAAKEFHFLED